MINKFIKNCLYNNDHCFNNKFCKIRNITINNKSFFVFLLIYKLQHYKKMFLLIFQTLYFDFYICYFFIDFIVF